MATPTSFCGVKLTYRCKLASGEVDMCPKPHCCSVLVATPIAAFAACMRQLWIEWLMCPTRSRSSLVDNLNVSNAGFIFSAQVGVHFPLHVILSIPTEKVISLARTKGHKCRPLKALADKHSGRLQTNGMMSEPRNGDVLLATATSSWHAPFKPSLDIPKM